MGGSMPCPRPLQATTILQSLSSSAPNLQRSALSLEIGRPRFDSSVSLSEPHPMAFQATLFGIVTEFRASAAKQSGSSCSLEGVNLKRCLPVSLAYEYEGFHQGKAALSTFRSKKYNERLGSRCIHPRSTSDIPEYKQQLCSSSLFVIAGRRGTELATNLSCHTCSARKRTSYTAFRKAGEVKAVISGLQESVLEEGAEQADAEVSIVENLLDFLNESWTPFHATAEAKRLLLEAGFKQLFEQDEWVVEPGGRYFFTRNMSAIIAFAIGQNYQAGKGFHVIAAHTDSPCPKLKPVSAALKSGFLNIGVQTYGGGLWHTWFDRDLTVAGRVLIKSRDGLLAHKLVKVRRPILRIPTLAIHLDRSVNTDGFKPNLETHLAPVLATQIKAGLNSAEGNGAVHSVSKAHHPLLLQVLADELNCEVDEIEDFELNVCDTQPSCIGGAKKEFIFSGRLDNLASSFCALRALLDSCRDSTDLASESCIRMVALFDNEEVGSDSAQGAGSPTMFQAMKRIARWLNRSTESEGIVERTIRRSFLVSADMAHALHPNYPERHEDHHQPKLHEGLVIKHNANQRYATNSVTAFLFREVAKSREIPTQNFVVRNDMGCGSTIGPILASGIGIRTVDCGMPQLSMHSVREMCGTEDVDIAYRHFKAFYHLFTSIDEQLSIDS